MSAAASSKGVSENFQECHVEKDFVRPHGKHLEKTTIGPKRT